MEERKYSLDLATPSTQIATYYPKNFFSKTVNEPFIKSTMESVLGKSVWRQGNPDKQEPDYFCNGVPFEFTIASDTRRKNNLVQHLIRRDYQSDDLQKDVFSFIEERIADKATKKYTVRNIHLCVLCLLEMFDWVSDYYGSYTHEEVDYSRQEFFEHLQNLYIRSRIFTNIFIIFPDMAAKWWVFDVKTNHRRFRQLSEQELQNRMVPFVLTKEMLEKLQES